MQDLDNLPLMHSIQHTMAAKNNSEIERNLKRN